MKSRAPARQKGFTLVEIAIVLVIIGLLLGGVLKGQSLIESSKIKALKNEMLGTATSLNAYLDRYKAIPGDDILVLTHMPQSAVAVPTVATGGGNGLIDGTTGNWANVGLAAAPAATNESGLFWAMLRAASLTNAGNQFNANNAVGGYLGVTSGVNKVTTPATSTAQFAVCSSGIKGSMARELDVAMDDGAFNTGSLWGAAEGTTGPIIIATAAVAAGAAGQITDNTLGATMCYGF